MLCWTAVRGVPGAVVGSCCVYGVAWAQRTS
ncbi:hypothetical protein SMICM17S_06963 [Streptomyces microflavus]